MKYTALLLTLCTAASFAMEQNPAVHDVNVRPLGDVKLDFHGTITKQELVHNSTINMRQSTYDPNENFASNAKHVIRNGITHGIENLIAQMVIAGGIAAFGYGFSKIKKRFSSNSNEISEEEALNSMLKNNEQVNLANEAALLEKLEKYVTAANEACESCKKKASNMQKKLATTEDPEKKEKLKKKFEEQMITCKKMFRAKNKLETDYQESVHNFSTATHAYFQKHASAAA